MRRLALLGAGGHGKVVADAALASGKWDEVVFFDDADALFPYSMSHWQVVGRSEVLIDSLDHYDGVCVGIGSNKVRQMLFERLQSVEAPIVSIIHPKAIISPYASIGVGTVVFAGSVINVDASIGCGAIINTAATVDHDCVIEDFAHLSPGVHLAGNTHVGKGAWLGTGVCTKQGVVIGESTVVGVGAAVISNLSKNLMVVGNPANRIL